MRVSYRLFNPCKIRQQFLAAGSQKQLEYISITVDMIVDSNIPKEILKSLSYLLTIFHLYFVNMVISDAHLKPEIRNDNLYLEATMSQFFYI